MFTLGDKQIYEHTLNGVGGDVTNVATPVAGTKYVMGGSI